MQTNEFEPRLAHAADVEATAVALNTGLAGGLSAREVSRRLEQFGPNRLSLQKREQAWRIFLVQVRESLIVLLLAVVMLYIVWGSLAGILTIFGVILAVVAVEFYHQRRAGRALDAVAELNEPIAWVRRTGQAQVVAAAGLVPGDVLLLQAGQRVAADARLVAAYGLITDEAALTGEALPVEKDAGVILPADAAVAERSNMVYAGTAVLAGRGVALVIATGQATEIGRMAPRAQASQLLNRPLQQAMGKLSRRLLWPALVFSILIPVLGFLAGQPLRLMLLTGVALAFATMPEGLPTIVTMILSLGAYRLAVQGAVVKGPGAVETLSTVTVIAIGETGTLTENQMTVASLWPEGAEGHLLELSVLCNDAPSSGVAVAMGAAAALPQAPQVDRLGDPLDRALLRYAEEAGSNPASLRCTYPLRTEFTFDDWRKLMSVVYERDGGRLPGNELWVAVKGAPEALLARSMGCYGPEGRQPLTPADKSAALSAAATMAGSGLRVIAFAERSLGQSRAAQGRGHLVRDAIESNLAFVGLVGLADLPRPEAQEAITLARSAGIRPLLITGDHPLTAGMIAGQVGLSRPGTRVMAGPEIDGLTDAALCQAVGSIDLYAPTTPEHRLRLVHAIQGRGERVAVTGGGSDDGPALAAADIGVAMGQTGTDMAREVADLTLADDAFATLVRAIGDARLLFANLTKAVRYYLACKVALVAATLLPVLLGLPVPFMPVQIILMELFMDLAAAGVFLGEPAEDDLMRRPPRDPGQPLMSRRMVLSIIAAAGGLFVVVSAAYLLAWYGTRDLDTGSGDLALAQSMAFFTWLMAHVLLALNLRAERQSLWRTGLLSNRLMLVWAGAVVVFVVLAAFVPGMQELFKTTAPSGPECALMAGLAVLGTFWIEGAKLIRRRG
jgi:P-type Ca2+ transporter type 2C